jgi:hypothetical protein
MACLLDAVAHAGVQSWWLQQQGRAHCAQCSCACCYE